MKIAQISLKKTDILLIAACLVKKQQMLFL